MSSETINSLPEDVRRFIHDLETSCDPAGMVRENQVLKDENTMLREKIAMLANDIAELENRPARKTKKVK